MKDLSLKKSDDEEPSISHSELVKNVPGDSQPEKVEETPDTLKTAEEKADTKKYEDWKVSKQI